MYHIFVEPTGLHDKYIVMYEKRDYVILKY